ncbi:hypothetical protein CLI64_16080 [Nostoc sp. CENA543]|nr:hypothetical protein CLI64_16080 [Nostoc sp. CENA543]
MDISSMCVAFDTQSYTRGIKIYSCKIVLCVVWVEMGRVTRTATNTVIFFLLGILQEIIYITTLAHFRKTFTNFRVFSIVGGN